MTRGQNKGVALAITTAFISGFSIFINKLAVTSLDPYVFTGLKNSLVSLFLFSLLLGGKQWAVLKKLSFKNWLSLLLIGALGGSLPFLLFFKGLSQTSSANAAFIHKNLFIFVALLAPVFLAEKPKKKFFLAAIFLLLGNFFLLKVFSFQLQRGDFLILLATFLWALENVFSKKLLKKLSPQIVAFGRMFFGSLLIVSFLIFNQSFLTIKAISPVEFKWILLTSLFLFGYVIIWYHSLRYIPVTLAASLLTLGSPVTTLLSLVFLGHVPDFSQTVGLVLLLAGGAVLLRQRRIEPCLA